VSNPPRLRDFRGLCGPVFGFRASRPAPEASRAGAAAGARLSRPSRRRERAPWGRLEGVHFHDLRHTGNQLTADAGANLKELMARMGQDSERAALIYLHSSAARQRVLADEVGRMAATALAKAELAKPSGTRRARQPNTSADSFGGSASDLGE
jgi:integrase